MGIAQISLQYDPILAIFPFGQKLFLVWCSLEAKNVGGIVPLARIARISRQTNGESEDQNYALAKAPFIP